MADAIPGQAHEVQPLLLRFRRTVSRPVIQFSYDPATQVNVVENSGVPAVLAGVDLKTQTRAPGED
jgi:hypothetical protein